MDASVGLATVEDCLLLSADYSHALINKKSPDWGTVKTDS